MFVFFHNSWNWFILRLFVSSGTSWSKEGGNDLVLTMKTLKQSLQVFKKVLKFQNNLILSRLRVQTCEKKPVLLYSRQQLACVCVFTVFNGAAKKSLHPPTNTPLSVEHTWMTEQLSSALPVWRRQSEQCFNWRAAGPRHTHTHTNPNTTLSPSASSASQNSTEPCSRLSKYVPFANLYSMLSVLFKAPSRRSGLPENWKIQSL